MKNFVHAFFICCMLMIVHVHTQPTLDPEAVMRYRQEERLRREQLLQLQEKLREQKRQAQVSAHMQVLRRQQHTLELRALGKKHAVLSAKI